MIGLGMVLAMRPQPLTAEVSAPDIGLPLVLYMDFASGEFAFGDSSAKSPQAVIDNSASGDRSYITEEGDLAIAGAGVTRVADYSLGSRAGSFEAEATNLLLNSATLSTQSVTVSAQEYTLHFEGTGTVALSGAHVDSIVGVGSGHGNRVALSFTPTEGSLTLTVSGDVTLAQLEVGTAPTAYIDTTATPITRLEDQACVSLSALDLSEGYTVVVDFVGNSQSAGGNFGRVFQLDDGTGGSRQQLMVYGASGVAGIELASEGNVGVVAYNIPLGYGVRQKFAWAFQEDYAQAAIGGTAGAADTEAGYTPPTILRIGHGIGPANWLNVHINTLMIYQGIASETQLETLTT